MADIGIKISATDAASGVFKTVAGEASRLQTSVSSVSTALASMGVSLSAGAFLAFVNNINNGVDALNDLKDATGASIENISALEDVARRTGSSFDTVSTALIKLNQGLSAAKPGSDTERAIKAIGLSVSDLKALDPAEAFRRIAVSLSAFDDDANKARLTQELFGKSLKEVAPLLKDLAEQGQLNATVTTAQAEAAEALNKQYFALQKNATDLARSVVNDLIPSLSALAIEMAAAKKTSLGFWDGVLTQLSQNPFKSAAENAAAYRDELKGLEADRQRLMKGGNDTTSIDTAIATLRRRQAYFREVQLQQTQFPKSDQSAAEEARLGLRKASVGDVLAGDGGKAAGAAAAKALQDQNRELAEQAKLLATLSGVNGDYQEQLTRLQVVRKSQNLSDARYAELVTELIDKQPMVRALYADQEKSAKAWADQSAASARAVAALTKDYDAYVKTLDNAANAVGAQVQKLQDEEAATLIAAQQNISLAEAIEQVTIARLRESQAKAYANGDQEAGDAIKREIEERKQLAKLIGNKDVHEANKKAADKIQDSITDALMRGFESGKGLAENLRDTVANMFKTMVLRPNVEMGVRAGMDLLGMGGAPGAAAAGGAGGMDWTNPSTLATLGNMAGGSFASAMMGGAGWMTGATTFGGSMTAAGSLMGTGTLAGGMAGAGMAAGAILPPLLIAAAVAEIAKGLDGGSEYTTGSGISGKFSGQQFAGRNYQDWQNDGDQFLGMSVGHSSSGTNYSGMDAAAQKSLGRAYGAILTQTTGFADALGANAASITGYQKDIKLSLGADAEANKKAIADMLKGVADEVAATVLDPQYIREGEGAADTLARLATSLKTVNGALDTLGDGLLTVSQISGDMASSLVDGFGGLQAYQGAISTYYQRFYSNEYRIAKTREQLTKQIGALGLSVPDSTAAFRDLVNAQDLSTESGRAAYAALVNMSGAFADITDAAAASAKAASDASKAAANAAADSFFAAIGNRSNAASLKTEGGAGVDAFMGASIEASKGVFDTQIASAQAASAAAAASLSSWQGIASTIKSTASGIDRQTQEILRRPFADLYAQFKALSVLAQGGDQKSADGLSNAASLAIAASESQSTSMAQYMRERSRISEGLADTLKTAEAQVSVQESIRSASDAAVAQLQSLNSNLTGFASQVYEMLQKGYDGSDRGTASDAAGKLAQASADFGSFFKMYAEGQMVAGAGGATFTRLSGDNASFTAGDGATSYLQANESIIDIAKRDPKLRAYWETQYGFKLPSFAVGTNYVPRDMLAQIHEGEAIVPKAYNPAAGGAPGNSDALIAEFRALRQEVAELRASSNTTAQNTTTLRQTMTNVTRGGESMLTVPA